MRKKEAHILIVDDDKDILFSARISLKKHFSQITTENNPKKILEHLSQDSIDVVLLDMNYRIGYEDGKEGLYWLKEINKISPETSVILMTAFGNVNLAVNAIKNGAMDFILKPWSSEKIYSSVNAGIELSRSKKKTSILTSVQETEKRDFHNKTAHIIGHSANMQEAKRLIEKVAPTDANILILGANGTGKYVFAKEIHRLSERNNHPFIHVDLGAINENLFESELFGYAKGAFTDAKKEQIGRFEMAKDGTIFLDEIGNLPLNLQSKLLSVIQSKTVTRLGEGIPRQINARIICATNAPLYDMVNSNAFRQDLLFRINTIELHLPSLKDRTDDIILLANYFLVKKNKQYRKQISGYSKAAIQALKQHSWPGNIRELEHIIERSVIICDNNEIDVQDLHFPSKQMQINKGNVSLNLDETEKNLIAMAMKKHSGNISKAARDLGITRSALYRRLEKHNL